MRVLPVVAAGLVLASFAAPGASADGLPVLNVDVGASGVAAPGGLFRYVTVPIGKHTIVEATRRDGGQIVRMNTSWPGTWTIPAVAYDGSASGLSADRRTLVLIEPRTSFPRAETRLLVVNARKLALDAAVIQLRGDFSFDAVSPNGSRIFLIHYTSTIDPTRYEVRALRRGRHGSWCAKPIVDPRDATEKMRGNPLSRVMSPDGRFAYTLYDGNGDPFVHALDTVCVDREVRRPRRPPAEAALVAPAPSDDGGTVLTVDRGHDDVRVARHADLARPGARPAASAGGCSRPDSAVLSAIGAALAVARRVGAGPASWAGSPRSAPIGFASRRCMTCRSRASFESGRSS